eukprot:TRINITY_DN8029_c2_g1_i4.p1 TRINITY_DN8029_c2_g1~~TRINITY_DN8029_c2_g1_i4.p1  ORF type:complete len:121 (+),score=2.42 TRINITY_DN8029_c2_g1_i4:146-508(+)
MVPKPVKKAEKILTQNSNPVQYAYVNFTHHYTYTLKIPKKIQLPKFFQILFMNRSIFAEFFYYLIKEQVNFCPCRPKIFHNRLVLNTLDGTNIVPGLIGNRNFLDPRAKIRRNLNTKIDC